MPRSILLGSLYVASWLIGFLVLVVPGGLGVREGAFVGVGSVLGFAPLDLTVYSLLARLFYTLSGICTAVLFILCRRKGKP